MKLELLDKISIINKVALESSSLTDEKKIVKEFTDVACKILKADYSYTFKWNNATNNFEFFYKDSNTPFISKTPRKQGITAKAFRNKIPFFIDQAKKVQGVRSDAKKFMSGVVVIPIVHELDAYGIMDVCFYKKHNFTREEKILCEYIGHSAAQAITIYRSRKKTEKNSQKLLKQKDQFFNIVSHELKTPVTTIKGFSQILNKKLGKSDTKTKYFLEKIDNQIDKLTRLVNDLLDISRIETGKLKFEENTFELQSLIKQVIEGLRISILSHPISFVASSQFWIEGDSERIEGVLINLITNAAKYSKDGSKIKVFLKEKDGKALVEVEDFGYGVPKKDRAKIFSRFFRSKDSNKDNLPGLGLGLYIASSIVKHYGGTLEIKPKEKGSIFFFTLPYYKSHV